MVHLAALTSSLYYRSAPQKSRTSTIDCARVLAAVDLLLPSARCPVERLHPARHVRHSLLFEAAKLGFTSFSKDGNAFFAVDPVRREMCARTLECD